MGGRGARGWMGVPGGSGGRRACRLEAGGWPRKAGRHAAQQRSRRAARKGGARRTPHHPPTPQLPAHLPKLGGCDTQRAQQLEAVDRHSVLAGHQKKGCRQEDGAAEVHVPALHLGQAAHKALLVGRQAAAHGLVVSRAPKLCGAGEGRGRGGGGCGRAARREPHGGSRGQRSGLRCSGNEGAHACLAPCLPASLPPRPPTWMHRSRGVALGTTPSTFCSAALALRYTWRGGQVVGGGRAGTRNARVGVSKCATLTGAQPSIATKPACPPRAPPALPAFSLVPPQRISSAASACTPSAWHASSTHAAPLHSSPWRGQGAPGARLAAGGPGLGGATSPLPSVQRSARPRRQQRQPAAAALVALTCPSPPLPSRAVARRTYSAALPCTLATLPASSPSLRTMWLVSCMLPCTARGTGSEGGGEALGRRRRWERRQQQAAGRRACAGGRVALPAPAAVHDWAGDRCWGGCGAGCQGLSRLRGQAAERPCLQDWADRVRV